MSIRCALAGLLFAAISPSLLWPGLLWADDEPALSPPPQTEATAAAETAAAKVAPAKADAANSAATEFQQAFGKFKKVLVKLHTLHTQFHLAAVSDRESILVEYEEYLTKASELVPVMQAAAQQAFQANPKDRDAADFLMANLVDSVEAERFSEGARLAEMLAAGGYSGGGFANYAGIAEFCTNDFARAKVNLQQASKEEMIDKIGKEALPQVDECARLWEVEQKIRAAEAEADNLPRVQLTTTNGDIVVELFENEAPNTTANFINLVEDHFYDGSKFHRVIPGFMAQGGGPLEGRELDYTIPCECGEKNSRKHFAGSLSMANAGPDTGNSQFFLTFSPRPNLNGLHTVFGRVVEGLDVLARLQRIDPDHPNPNEKPDEIVKATVFRKRGHDYEVHKNPDTKSAN